MNKNWERLKLAAIIFPFPYYKGSLPAVALAKEGPEWGETTEMKHER